MPKLKVPGERTISRDVRSGLASQPSHLVVLAESGLRPAWVALDTETSGLFADDGARVSTVSVAWPDPRGEWGPDRFEGLHWQVEEIVPGHLTPIVSIAWPFDQGVQGKPEAGGTDMLWPDAMNLPLEEWMALLSWVQDIGDLAMHNSPFDVEKMRVGVRRFNLENFGGADLCDCVTWDTQNVNDLLWGWERTSLKPTCERLWPKRWPADASEQKRVKDYLRRQKLPAGRWDLIPWDIIGQYADDDARMTAMLKLRQQAEIGERGGAAWHGTPTQVLGKAKRRLETSGVLTRMTERGLPYHEDASYAAAEAAREVMAGLAQQFPFDPSKDADIKAYYFGSGRSSRGEPGLDLTPYAMTDPSKKHPSGQPSLTAEVLDRMLADDVPWSAELLAYQRVATAESMWYRGYAEKTGDDGRLRTSFRQNGTRSTRFSVERVNLQAVPQDYRFSGVSALAGIPTPRDLIRLAIKERYPGWGLFSLDLAQAELRIASLYAGEDKMIEMIAAGEDLHGYTTTALFDVSKAGAEWDLYRGVGKRANFSLCFGSGSATFQKMLASQAGIRWSLDQCDFTVRGWRKLYPAFVGADGRGGAVGKHSRVVEQRMHRDSRMGGPGVGHLSFRNKERRWFQPYEESHKAFNQRVQGDQAQYGIDWLLETDRYLRGLGLDNPGQTIWTDGVRDAWSKTAGGKAGLLLPIHDSQELLLPLDGGQEIAEKCAAVGRELWDEWFPGMSGEIEVKRW